VQSGLLEQAQDALHGAEVEEKMAKDEERIVRREAARLEEEAMDASLAMDAAVLEEAMLREAAIQYAAEVEGTWRTANFKQAKSRASYPAERESWLTLCFPPFLSSPLHTLTCRQTQAGYGEAASPRSRGRRSASTPAQYGPTQPRTE
jgi:hypothetical protein